MCAALFSIWKKSIPVYLPVSSFQFLPTHPAHFPKETASNRSRKPLFFRKPLEQFQEPPSNSSRKPGKPSGVRGQPANNEFCVLIGSGYMLQPALPHVRVSRLRTRLVFGRTARGGQCSKYCWCCSALCKSPPCRVAIRAIQARGRHCPEGASRGSEGPFPWSIAASTYCTTTTTPLR